MSYVVLARRFRPQKFATIAGQEHVTKALANSLVRDRIPHALLFCGPRGVGKTSAARVYAKALNCTGRAQPLSEVQSSDADELERRALVEPCGECSACEEIARSTSLAVREIDGASNNSVDNIRELIDTLRSPPPPGASYKIYIIDEVHMLSTAAFNALLKSLEEPPPKTVFVFATTEPQKIPETVLSRCQRYDFRNLTADVILEQLQQVCASEGKEVSTEILELVTRKAEGGMRDAQTLLDRLLSYSENELTLEQAQRLFGVLGKEFFISLSSAVLKREPGKCFELVARAFSESLDLRNFVSDFLAHFRTLLLLSILVEKNELTEKVKKEVLRLTERDCDMLQQQIEGITSFDMQRLFDIAESLADQLLRSNHPRYVIEAGLARMATLQDLKPIAEVVELLRSGANENTAPTQVTVAREVEHPKASGRASAPKQAVEKKKLAQFDPSWEAFVSFVNEKQEFVLEAHLKRVSPVSFHQGSLELTGKDFDISSIKHEETISALKKCLEHYSGEASWNISFLPLSELGEAEQPVITSKERGAAVAGSLEHANRKSRQNHKKKIETEAMQKEAVREALTVFAGSSIEKVSVLKSN